MFRYCPYCMTEFNVDAPCPHCGKDPESYQHLSHHFPPNKLLASRYYVGRVLGEGGFGITYLGLDTRLKRKVAIKEYFPTGFVKREVSITSEVTCYTDSRKAFYEKGRDRFLKEAQTLAEFDKIPGTVQVLDTFMENNTAYIVMELLEGKTFGKLLSERGRIPARELLEAVAPVLKAMSGIHAKGIIHRDISPDNIMLLSDGTAKLLDFGCARETTNEQTMTVMLKHGYAPMEQYTGHNQGAWTDIYALSATLYHCLTGKKPPSALDRDDKKPLPTPNELGAGLTETQEQGLMKGLAIKPEDRWQSIAELYDALYGSSIESVSQPTVPLVHYSENGTELIITKKDLDDRNTIQDNTSKTTPDNQKNLKKAGLNKVIAACAAAAVLLAAVFAWGNFSRHSEAGQENNKEAAQGNDMTDGAESTEPPVQGTSWSFANNVLKIQGSGPMDDYPFNYRPWDNHRPDIKKVVIEDGVTSVGEYAFYECRAITDVQIPASVIAVGSNAFKECENLGRIAIPDGVASINDDTFSGCEKLREVIIPDSVNTIGDGVFSGCYALQTITIPDSVISIGTSAFSSSGLTNVTIPAGLQDVPEYAFWQCGDLISVNIPDSVVSIGKFAFSRCSNLKNAAIPDSVTLIDESAFGGCTNLEDIELPSSCQYYHHSFPYNSIVNGGTLIPQGQAIGYLWDVKNGVLTVRGYINGDGIMDDSESDIYVPWHKIKDNITEVVIKDSITHIGDYAFYGLNAETIEIPDSVTSIGSYAFSRSGLVNITIPDSVTSIGEGAFAQCGITDITIPNTISRIENAAFSRNSLTSVTIPNSVRSIGAGAFMSCESLTDVKIPDNVVNIDEDAFAFCDSLRSVTIAGNCQYYASSFPDTCKVTGGTLIE